MKQIRPWYRWHWHRFLNSPRVMRMGLAAKGAYRGLIDKGWELGGRLPNDREILWKYAGASSPEEFEPIAEQVILCFTVSEDGKWLTNETLTEEWEATDSYLEDLSDKRSEAGKIGNQVRWSDRKPSQTIATPSQSIAQHKTLATQDNTGNSKPSAEESADDRHKPVRQLVQEWWKKQNPEVPTCPWDGEAGAKLKRLLKKTPQWTVEHFDRCLQHLYQSHSHVWASPPDEYILSLPKYLNGPLNKFKQEAALDKKSGAAVGMFTPQ